MWLEKGVLPFLVQGKSSIFRTKGGILHPFVQSCTRRVTTSSALDQLGVPQLLHALARLLLPEQIAVVKEGGERLAG